MLFCLYCLSLSGTRRCRTESKLELYLLVIGTPTNSQCSAKLGNCRWTTEGPEVPSTLNRPKLQLKLVLWSLRHVALKVWLFLLKWLAYALFAPWRVHSLSSPQLEGFWCLRSMGIFLTYVKEHRFVEFRPLVIFWERLFRDSPVSWE